MNLEQKIYLDKLINAIQELNGADWLQFGITLLSVISTILLTIYIIHQNLVFKKHNMKALLYNKRLELSKLLFEASKTYDIGHLMLDILAYKSENRIASLPKQYIESRKWFTFCAYTLFNEDISSVIKTMVDNFDELELIKQMIVGRIGIIDSNNNVHNIKQSELVFSYLWNKGCKSQLSNTESSKIDIAVMGKIDEYEEKAKSLKLFIEKSQIFERIMTELNLNDLDKK